MITVLIERDKTSETVYEELIPETVSVDNYGKTIKMLSVSMKHQLLPEVQAWVDDGRILSYHITHIVIPAPPMNQFNIRDRRTALMFKLAFG